MSGRSTIFLLAALSILTGCANIPRDPLHQRQRAYERLASFLEPGMTRRQLYALLPPQGTPTFTRSTCLPSWGISALPGPACWTERQRLDADFELDVSYLPSDGPKLNLGGSRQATVSADAIDKMILRSPEWKIMTDQLNGHYKQGMSDRLFSRPVVVRSLHASFHAPVRAVKSGSGVR